MTLAQFIFGATIALTSGSAAVGKMTRLQTVNITERELSLEGGEARLYQVDQGERRFCRIEVVHYGETGKWIYVFDFAAKLFAADSREYRYSGSIYSDSNVEAILTRRSTLASRKERDALTRDFAESRAFFDAGRLARCSGK